MQGRISFLISLALSVAFPCHGAVTLTYLPDATSNRLSRILPDDGGVVSFEYDAAGNLVARAVDSDADGCLDHRDAFPQDAAECGDYDRDGLGDGNDLDDDQDGIPDRFDGAPFDSGNALTDTDADGYNAYQEYIAGTDASDPASNLSTEGGVYTSVTGDVDGIGGADIVAVFVDEAAGVLQIALKDSLTGADVSSIAVGPDFIPRFATLLTDVFDDGDPVIALLSVDATNAITLSLINALSGATVREQILEAAFNPLSLHPIPDVDGNLIGELGLYARRESDSRPRVQLVDNDTGDLVSEVFFDKIFHPLLLGVFDDFDADANGVPELGMLGIRLGNKQVRIQIKDAFDLHQLAVIFASTAYEPIALEVIPDLGVEHGHAQGVAVLQRRRQPGDGGPLVRVHIRNAETRAFVNNVTFNGYDPLTLKRVPDLNGDGVDELAVLGVDDVENRTRVWVRDVFSNRIDGVDQIIFFNVIRAPDGLTVIEDFDGAGTTAFAVSGTKANGSKHVLVKDGNGFIGNIPLP